MKLIISHTNAAEEALVNTDGRVVLEYEQSYQHGDAIEIQFEPDEIPAYYWVQLDSAMLPAKLYFTQPVWRYVIPFGEQRLVYPETSFAGEKHLVQVWQSDIPYQQTNLAFNPYDQVEPMGAFPHAEANIETRHDPTFAAKNAIDGYILNAHHGEYPYQSWGINRDPEAQIHLSFGRPITLKRIAIVLRADFPHDSVWTSGLITFDDGTSMTLSFDKTADRQWFETNKSDVTGFSLDHLVKADDESPFPALTEIEAY
ncbi:hypothetical protein [Lacticaseibacillus saniviri]|uniref:hypothetical protein n=1 Tax=Lacticaseibacillus saniviri TaxID=931533 RepID=UPI001EDF5381|nr:hypothetical protein [Lacticaseibacillus saniviri]MCG4282669.1 hypothetical protein [Lacticaseibacillus saniviri]